MSTAPTPSAKLALPERIKIVSHSSLFYWWPVWAFGFLFAFWSWVEDSRMLVLPSKSQVKLDSDNKAVTVSLRDAGEQDDHALRVMKETENKDNVATTKETMHDDGLTPRLRCTSKVGLGTFYLFILWLVIFITNVPLRGLWSIVAIILLVMLALIFSLAGWWDDIFRKLGNLHVYINMGGYLFLSTSLFLVWFIAVNFFDKRTYVIISKGQIRVCEEIGGSEITYDSMGATAQKHRDDIFRHWVLGGGSGDLTIKTAGAQAHTIAMPNVLWIGWRLPKIEALLNWKTVSSPAAH